MNSPCHEAFVAGTFIDASEDALIIKSLTESFTDECLFSFSHNANRFPTSHSTET